MTRAAWGSEDAPSHPSAGAPVLNCPGCGSKVAANASICSVCDYIIDGSFLSAEPPGDNDDESTGANEDPRPAPKPAAPSRPRPAGKSAGSRPPPAASADATNVRSVEDIAKSASQRASRPAPASRSAPNTAPRRSAPAAATAPAAASAGPDPWDRAHRPDSDDEENNAIVNPDELIQDAKDLLGAMSTGDKIAFYGAGTVILSCFVPWKETAADGDALGLMSMGFGAFLLALVVMVTISIRARSTFPNLNPVVPWMAQLITTIMCVVWCVVFIKVSSDTTLVPSPIGNSEMMNSSPSFGVFIGLLGAIAALIGAFLGLKSRNED
ncbi:hypothetical protein JY572_00990 [Myxococcus landrumensis]|uniref:Zinc ribbon domain-containing protein n=1 Tax=Myxococcus landrumensis TaxID=2813577 RepID=A0ABX7N7J7_9BACT|nr:hypothetical protein JY572_00990 [Myxococcus landrumus]